MLRTPLDDVVSRLNVSGSGTGRRWMRKEFLLMALLGAIIVGAIVVAIVTIIPSSPGGGQSEMHYLCTKCGAESVVKIKDLPPEARMTVPSPMGGLPPIDCPKCGAKASAYQERQCINPQCRKWFVPTFQLPGRPGVPPGIICPHCKVNQTEYAAAHPSSE